MARHIALLLVLALQGIDALANLKSRRSLLNNYPGLQAPRVEVAYTLSLVFVALTVLSSFYLWRT